MEGKIKINADEVKEMVSSWFKNTVSRDLNIISITNSGYSQLDIDVTFSSNAKEEEEDDGSSSTPTIT